MLLIQNGVNCEYEMNIFMRLFFDKEEDAVISTSTVYENGVIDAYCEIIYNDNVYFGGFRIEKERTGIEKEDERYESVCCIRAFLDAAEKIYNVSLPWGAMCGIRPAKAVTTFVQNGMSYQDAVKILHDIYGVSEEKCALAETVARNESNILSTIKNNSVSIYIGIPFCPSRCLYCSFVSTDIKISGKYIDEFIEKLILEIECTAKLLEETGKVIEHIYIGGGTPTTLDEVQLEKLLSAIRKHFKLENLNEFTLEAGRPDTITKEKLLIAKSYGVNRVSINPQSTNDETLKKIGRKHDTAMFMSAYEIAKEVGFDVINTDLIAGLPGETPEDFRRSIDDIVKLSPENITVHSMCIKRAADLRHKVDSLTEARDMTEMLSYAQKTLEKEGYTPYYMYRQKNISGNLENVGYARDGAFSFYNVNIMEEAQTIIALGGGGSTKLVTDGGIERIFNYKDPAEYIRNFDEIIKRKMKTAEILKEGAENADRE